MQATLEDIIAICRQAGREILAIYEGTDFEVETKDDDSPLTAADLASHRAIVEGLAEIAPDIPVLSEESDGIPWSQRRSWQRYFLVDPLDGTREFVSRNGEFTVNVALIHGTVPVLGVVYVPVKDVLYAGFQHEGDRQAFVERGGERRSIQCRCLTEWVEQGHPLTVVASRRHGGEALAECITRLERHFSEIETKNMGSSLKFCLVAEGEADFYPRLAPTSEWDTAAAQAVVEGAGGRVVDTAFLPLAYNTKDDILNPHFYVLGDTRFDWQKVLA